LDGLISRGRQGGQGKGVSGGVGIQLGQDVNNAGNGCTLDSVYVSNFEVDLYNKYASPTVLEGLPLFGGASTAVWNASGKILYTSGEIYFDSYNDMAIRNDGYFTYAAQLSSLGTQSIGTTSHRLFKRGHDLTVVNVYKNATQSIASGSPVLVTFPASLENTEGWFDTTKSSYTATYPGYRSIFCQLNYAVSGGHVNNAYQVRIYKNSSEVAEGSAHSPATTGDTVSPVAGTIQWLDVGDTVEVYAWQNEGGAINLNSGATQSYLLITDAN